MAKNVAREHSGGLSRQALFTQGLPRNITATSNPGVGDDIDSGYNVGSIWVNVSSDAIYFCADPAAGAAVWALTASQAVTDITALSDADSNFIVGNGSAWVVESGATARTSLGLGTAAVAATGISNTNVPVFTSGVADNDFLRVDGTSVEGLSASEVAAAIESSIDAVGTIASGTWQGTAIASAYIANDAIDSDHYTDGSIDTAHIADNQVTLAKIEDIARGSIIIGNASAATAELTVGSNNYVLTSDGTDIAWAAAAAGDIESVTAGTGLSGGGSSGGVTLALDLSELADTAIADGDYIVFTDTTDSNASVKGDLADVATLFAGTGLTASSSVIGVDASQTQITAVGTIATGVWEATDVAVAHGGTGASSLTSNAVLTGNGTSAIQAETDLLFSSNKLIPTASAHDAAGTALTVSAGATTAGTSNNQAGGALTFQGGQGKGSGAGGAIVFQVANEAASGSSLNSLATALTINDDTTITTAGAIELGHASDTTLARSGSGDLTIEGNAIYRAGGTDVAVADGGTGASSLNNLITLATHTTGDFVKTITAGTGLTSTGATSGEDVDHSLSVDASQTQITGVGTITTGTWEGTTVAVDQGGTGATSLTNLITLATHTTGDYVQNITAGTGLTSTGATSGENIAHSLSVDASQTQITSVGILDAGSITSNFGTINTGASDITTTGTVSAGNLTVTGTTTTINSTVTTVVDPIMHLQTASGGGALGADTNKDVGLALQYYTDAAKTAFLGYDDSVGRLSFVKEASITSEVVSGTLGDLDIGGIYATDVTLDGDKSVTPGDGAMLHVDTSTITDSNTAGSGTATKYTHIALEAPTLAATNASVTTSDAATLYINNAATAGTNQTITRNWAVWVDAGNARFDGSIYSGTTEAIDSSGLVTVANQSNITGVGTITSGTWEGTTVAVAQGGTGATSLTNLITLATHTTGDYVQNITAGTGLTSSGATSGENIAHSLSVDASQTQVTSVGTVTTGTWSTGAVIAGATMTLGSDAEGDVYYRNSSGVLTRLAKGSDNDTLMMNGNVPNWEAVTEGASAGFSVAMAIAL